MKLRSIAIAGALAITGLAAGTAAPAPAAAAPSNCVTVYDFPDAGLKYCYYVSGPCLVTQTQTTFLGTETTCVVRNPVY
jgi:hypothetical protein